MILELQSTHYGMHTNNYFGMSAVDNELTVEPYNRHLSVMQNNYRRLTDIATELASSPIFKQLKK